MRPFKLAYLLINTEILYIKIIMNQNRSLGRDTAPVTINIESSYLIQVHLQPASLSLIINQIKM